MVFLKLFGRTRCIDKNEAQCYLNELGIGKDQFYCLCSGKVIKSFSNLQSDSTIEVFCALKGGKGGFGAKLKTEGGKKVRPNENMFSRDTQGRPIAYATVQREYQEYYRRKCEEDEKVKKQLSEFKIVENTLKQQNAFIKLDRTYNAEMEITEKRLEDAFKIGFKKYLEKVKSPKAEPQQEQVEKSEVQDEVQVEVQDEQLKQLEPTKRPRPICKQEEGDQLDHQIKKGRQNQKNEEQKKEQTTPIKPATLLSAREKLKSLFKK